MLPPAQHLHYMARNNPVVRPHPSHRHLISSAWPTLSPCPCLQMLNVVFQRMEAGSTHVVVPPIMVSDLLGLPPADASNMSAFVQQFLADVVATVDPFGTVAQGIQEVGRLAAGPGGQ